MTAESPARRALMRRLREEAARDPRIVGLLDYGSSSEGRVDVWSDVDVALFIRDADFAPFVAAWRGWVAGLGDLLLAYIGQVGHPWTVFAGEPVPLRADFNFYPASRIDAVLAWPNSPVSVEAMVLYDDTGGALSANVGKLVGRSLRLADPHAAFEQVCGDFWYYLLFTYCKLRRGQSWVARQAFHGPALENLLWLLRIEAGATDTWGASSGGLQIERVASPERLARLDACIPAPDDAGLVRALTLAAHLGRDVCAAIAARAGWPWPDALAEQTIGALRD